MKKLLIVFTTVLLAATFVQIAAAQTKKPNRIIFAVVNDGKGIEPLAKVENGKLMQTVSGGDDAAILAAFHKTYYAPQKAYGLIFGGVNIGSVTVKKSDPKTECSAAMAEVVSSSTKAKLNGFVMALATDIVNKKPGSGLRRKPTPAERIAIERLVTAEFTKNKVSGKTLQYHNLTALDIDNDKVPEFTGSYWVNTSATERALLFFIAKAVKGGKYALSYSDFRLVKKDEVMSGEISALDQGTYHELLLDVLDFDDNGTAEIFTIIEGFEGSSFNAYQLKAGKFEKVLESSNYHCGY